MDIHPEFRKRRNIKRKRQFDEGANDDASESRSAGQIILYLLLIKLYLHLPEDLNSIKGMRENLVSCLPQIDYGPWMTQV